MPLPRLIDLLAPSDADSPALREGEPRNFALIAVSQVLNKVADGLADPKLVLASLLSAAGAPGLFIGALAPVREAGSLLPQVALAPWVARSRLRKRVWAAGAAAQGVAALGMAASALLLSGWAAGAGVLACLAALAVARSVCSLSHKDALARTVAKTRRGSVSGAATSVAAAGTLAFGAGLATGVIPRTLEAVAAAVALAGLLWIAAGLVFLALAEPETPARQRRAARGAGVGFGALRRAPQLRQFVATRALLTATAIAPPYMVMLSAGGEGGALGALGPLVLASGAASAVSSWVWGRFSDESSRRTLATAALMAAAALGASAAMGFATGGLGGPAGAAAAVFGLQLAYAGVRQGRKTHLTDMAPDDRRAAWTAVANTAVGATLLIGPVFGWLADAAGAHVTLAALAALCAVAIPSALRLEEVQRETAET